MQLEVPVGSTRKSQCVVGFSGELLGWISGQPPRAVEVLVKSSKIVGSGGFLLEQWPFFCALRRLMSSGCQTANGPSSFAQDDFALFVLFFPFFSLPKVFNVVSNFKYQMTDEVEVAK